MISNANELNVALHQLSSFADMLEALQRDAADKNDWALFPLVSAGYFHKIREINSEIRAYLHGHSEAADGQSQTHASVLTHAT
jgi:hypothetical protein